MSLPRHRRPAALVGAGVLAVVALGACSSQGGSAASAGSSAVAPGSPEVGDPAAPPDAAAADGSSQSGAGVAKPGSPASPADVVLSDKLVRTAALQVQVDDVEEKAAEARRIAVSAGGTVIAENSSAIPRGSDGTVDKQGSRSNLTLAVPSETLDRVLDDLGKLGTTASRSSSSRDVTTTYVDTQSRSTTMKAGLDQLRALLSKAADLNQVIALETEISRRQADLDALQAQLKALDAKVAMSTVSLTLTTAAQVGVPEEGSGGFLSGLRAGWSGFVKTSAGILTVLGMVLPFLAAAALIGGPVLLWRRRRTTAAHQGGTGYAGFPGSGPAGPGGGPGSGGPGPGGPGSGGPGAGGPGPDGPSPDGPGSDGPGSGNPGSTSDPDGEPVEEREPERVGAS